MKTVCFYIKNVLMYTRLKTNGIQRHLYRITSSDVTLTSSNLFTENETDLTKNEMLLSKSRQNTVLICLLLFIQLRMECTVLSISLTIFRPRTCYVLIAWANIWANCSVKVFLSGTRHALGWYDDR